MTMLHDVAENGSLLLADYGGVSMSHELYILDTDCKPTYAHIFDMEFCSSSGEKLSYLEFKKGIPLASLSPVIKFWKSNKKKMPDFLHNMYLLPVVSKAFRDILAQLNVNSIEYFPISVEYKGVLIDHSHMLMNILGGQHCIIDWRKSSFQPSYHKCAAAFKLTHVELLEDAIPKSDIFWEAECRELVVTQKVADALLSAKISGIKLIAIPEYRGRFHLNDNIKKKIGE